MDNFNFSNHPIPQLNGVDDLVEWANRVTERLNHPPEIRTHEIAESATAALHLASGSSTASDAVVVSTTFTTYGGPVLIIAPFVFDVIAPKFDNDVELLIDGVSKRITTGLTHIHTLVYCEALPIGEHTFVTECTDTVSGLPQVADGDIVITEFKR